MTDEPVIGMIDTAVWTDHPSLSASSLLQRDFLPANAARTYEHGTSVAALIVGEQTGYYRGVSPGAVLMVAGVVGQTDGGGLSASADMIVVGLDWLVSEGAMVINVSLAGPPNATLKTAIQRAQAQGVMIAAAVGNDGPAAPPLYPAAYDGVIGVSAVDRDMRVYRRAGRGDHVDISALGVDVRVASLDGGYARATGTSFATPIVVAALANTSPTSPQSPPPAPNGIDHSQWVDALMAQTVDLGDAGRDQTYGEGALPPTPDDTL